MVVLVSGGWLAVGVGVLLGPHATGVVSAEGLVGRIDPILQAALGWVGLMVGLQARGEVLRRLPGGVRRLWALDSAVSVVLFGGVALAGLWLWAEPASMASVLGMAAVIACGSVGWSMETRSLKSAAEDPAEGSIELLVRGAGSLGALSGTLLLGVVWALVRRGDDGTLGIDLLDGVLRLGSCVVASVALAYVGRLGIKLASKQPDQQLVVFLGLVAMTAGLSAQMGLPALFGATLTGVVLANLASTDVRRIERFILRAEHVVATLVSLLAGAWLGLDLPMTALALVLAIAIARLVVKPWLLRMVVGEQTGSRLRGLAIGPVRQGPIAVALAVSAVLLEPSALASRVLGVVVLAGLASDAIPLLVSAGVERKHRRERREEEGGS